MEQIAIAKAQVRNAHRRKPELSLAAQRQQKVVAKQIQNRPKIAAALKARIDAQVFRSVRG